MNHFLIPKWPAPANVRSLITTRAGGVSLPPFDSLNLGAHVGDASAAVKKNREILRKVLPSEPRWLNQTHGIEVANLDISRKSDADADAAFSRTPDTVCAVMTADCLPILLCNEKTVCAIHAGWKGLASGIVEKAVSEMQEESLLAYLGPAIGPESFEVGAEVRESFVENDPEAGLAFKPWREGKFLADLYLLARQRLIRLGIQKIYGGEYCTFNDPARFYSYRRDGKTGRMASLIWLERL